jgi:hypothetical protein
MDNSQAQLGGLADDCRRALTRALRDWQLNVPQALKRRSFRLAHVGRTEPESIAP